MHGIYLNKVISSIAKPDKCNIANYKYMLLNMCVEKMNKSNVRYLPTCIDNVSISVGQNLLGGGVEREYGEKLTFLVFFQAKKWDGYLSLSNLSN